MPDDLLQALAAARPDLDPVPDRARRDRDLTRALASAASPAPTPTPAPARRGRSLWKAAGLGVVAAGTAAAVIATTGTTPPAPRSRPSETAPTPPSAREILLAAGASSLKAPADEGDFLYTHWISGRQISIPGKDYLLDSRTEQEMWRAKEPGHHQYMINRNLGTALASPASEQAWKADGSPRGWTFEIPPFKSFRVVQEGSRMRIELEPPATTPDVWRHVSDFGVGRIGSRLATPENLAKLPTDPKALYDRLLRELTAMSDAAPKENRPDPATRQYLFSGDLFHWGVDLIARLPVSPALRSAAFGMLSHIPGVASRGEMTDPLGRTGQAIALTGRADNSFVRKGEMVQGGTLYDTVLIIDPSTGTALALVDQISKPVWPPSDKQGQWRSYELFKESRWIPALPMSRLRHAKHSR